VDGVEAGSRALLSAVVTGNQGASAQLTSLIRARLTALLQVCNAHSLITSGSFSETRDDLAGTKESPWH
jgi:hypothetical protein